VRRAILSSHGDRAPLLLSQLLQDQGFIAVPLNGRDDTLREFAAATASLGNPEEIGQITDLLQGEPRWWHFSIVRGLSEGMHRGPLKKHGSLGKFCAAEGARFVPVLTTLQRAGELALDSETPEADRLAAIPLAEELGFEEAMGVIEPLLSPWEPALVQAAACRSLGRFPPDQVADFLFARWNDLGPLPLREALGILTRSSATALRLMEKMKAGEINKALMPPMQRWSYCRSGDAKIKALATELFGTPDADRGKVIADYESAIAGLKGESARGREVFEKAACITCHKIDDLGREVGPALSDVRLKLPSALLTDILDPNRMMEERWTAYTVKTTDGRTLIGLVTGEGTASLRLTMAGGETVSLARSEIKKMTSTGQSLMPVGLESAISKQEMADLIAFLKGQ
jgi:putative heme-binding domain-containing protein